PQRRRRLARVEDGDAAAGGVDEPAGAGGDAGEALQKIERGSLADQQRARRREHGGDLLAGRAGVAVALLRLDPRRRLDQPERLERHLETGDDAVGLDEEDAARL